MRDILSIEEQTRAVQGQRHAVELQSLRGLAAVVVLLHHCTFYYSYNPRLKFFSEALLNAHAAVVCFFVLSGFVLSLSLRRSSLRPSGVFSFYIRRMFRIYPALWAAALIGVLYVALFHGRPLSPMVDPWWGPSKRHAAISIGNVIGTLTGFRSPLVVPIWTLSIELIGSIIMPFLIWTQRRGTALFVATAIALALLSQFTTPRLFSSTSFLVEFAMGAAIPLATQHVAKFVRTTQAAALVGLSAFALMWFGRLAFNARFADNYGAPFPGFIEGIGAAILTSVIYVRPGAFSLLRHPSLIWLGDISYSLYLIHAPILGLVAGLCGEVWGLSIFTGNPLVATAALVVATLIISASLAALLYRFVELPGIRLGKLVVAKFDRDQRRSALAARPHLNMDAER